MADGYVYGSDGAVTGQSQKQAQSVSGGQKQQMSPAERIKAQQDKESTFVWKDNGNGMLVNQHGQLKTKHVAVVISIDLAKPGVDSTGYYDDYTW